FGDAVRYRPAVAHPSRSCIEHGIARLDCDQSEGAVAGRRNGRRASTVAVVELYNSRRRSAALVDDVAVDDASRQIDIDVNDALRGGLDVNLLSQMLFAL